jgi:hypothetical protein
MSRPQTQEMHRSQEAQSAQMLSMMGAQLERRLLPHIDDAVLEQNVKLGSLVVPDANGTITWNLPRLEAIVDCATNKSGVTPVEYNATKITMERNGVDNWHESFTEKTYLTAITATMRHQVQWGSLNAKTIETFQRLPLTNVEIPRVQQSWLTFMMKGRTDLASEVLRRACEVYGNIATLLPESGSERARLIRPRPDAEPVLVDAHALALLKARLHTAEKAGGALTFAGDSKYTIAVADIKALQDMSFRDAVAVATDDAARARRAMGRLQEAHPFVPKVVTAATVALGAGLVVSPAAALETSTSASSPASIPGLTVPANNTTESFVFVEATGKSTDTTAETTVAIPAAHNPSQAIPAATSAPAETVMQTSNTPLEPLSELGVEYQPPGSASPVVSRPQQTTEQTVAHDIDPLKELREGGLTPEEQLKLAVTLGIDSPSMLPPTSEAGGNKSIKPLKDTNLLLAEFVGQEVATSTSSTQINGTTEAVVGANSYRKALMFLNGTKGNMATLSSMTEEQTQQLLDGLTPAQAAVVNRTKEDFLEKIQRGENGAAMGLNEKQQQDLAILLAIASLGAENPAEAQKLVRQEQAKIDKAAADKAAAEKAAADKAAAEEAAKKAAEAPAEAMSDRAIELKALDLMMRNDNQFIARGAQVAKELMTLPEDLDGRITRQIAFGAVANVRDETGTKDLDFSTKQRNGPAVGGFQWEGGRKTNLYAFADRQGKAWTDQTVQLMNFIRELEGPESGAWNKIKNADSSEEAATLILRYFERARDSRAGGTNDRERKNYAAYLEEAYGKALAQVKAEQKALEVQRAKDAEKAAAEANKYPEIWNEMPAADRERLVWILDNVKRDKSQLLERFEATSIKRLGEEGYKNGKLPNKLLKTVDSAGHKMEISAANAYIAMNKAFRAEHPGRNLTIGGASSAYRTLQQQIDTKASAEAKGRGAFASEAGESPHGLGYALDLGPVASEFGTLERNWIVENGWKYGYFYSVQHSENGEIPEPWHVEKKN